MTWMQALKIWNKGKKKWTIPKKNSEEYKQIKKIMAKH